MKVKAVLDNMEYGGWWKARILEDELAALGGECPHGTCLVTCVDGTKFKKTCCACGSWSYTKGLTYKSDGEWHEGTTENWAPGDTR